jgi:hypothetical protein
MDNLLELATYVNLFRYRTHRAPGDDAGALMEQDVHTLLGLDEEESENTGASEVHVKYNKMLHGRGRMVKSQVQS